MNPRPYLFVAAVALAAAVVLGAFGAHALKPRLPSESFAVYQTADAAAAGTLDSEHTHCTKEAWAAWLLVAGILLFSGSLYALALTGKSWLGMLTPLGGAAFIAAWLVVAWIAVKH